MDRTQKKALNDFTAEAEEILEQLAQDLDTARAQFEDARKVRPNLLNKIFREMHSLKGLASMLGLEHITNLSHDLESFLDKVRMGKVKPGAPHFNLLGDCLNRLRTLVAEAGEEEGNTSIGDLIDRIASADEAPTEETVELSSGFELDEATLSSLTEYEEHRLKENMEEGNRIYAVQVGFDFSDFDVRLRTLSEKLNEKGEAISTLPVMDPDLPAGIHFRILVGTHLEKEEMETLVADAEGIVMDLMPPSSGGISEEASGEEEPRESETDESPPQETVEEVRTISNTVKVHIGKLDAVMGVLGELSLVRTSLWSQAMDILSREGMGETGASLVKQVRTMERKLKELQRAIVEIRMVPIGQIFNRLNRTARQLARNSGKEISVHLYGGETELDKVMMEEMLSPLVHIIRNSIDHGLESPTERLKENKQPTGNLVIAAYQKGNSIVIEVTDDGRGIQYDRILSTALEKGLVDDQAALSKEELMELIFLPGFSSAEKVTEVSGRGVGLDAVKDAIEGLKGSIGVWSEPNEGTTFQITLPITLAIIQSLIVDSCDQFYAIPISSILETIRLTEKEIQFVDQREVFDLRGTTLPLLRLEERFWQYRRERQEGDQLFVVVVRRGERMAGIVVDSLRGEQETVVHPLGERLSRIPGIAGATEIGENQVILVIDTASLFATSETVHV